MAEKISIPRPDVDQVALVVCDAAGTQASIVFNLVIFQNSDLREFLPILREAQDRARRIKTLEAAAREQS